MTTSFAETDLRAILRDLLCGLGQDAEAMAGGLQRA
jgi:hypothetical protein